MRQCQLACYTADECALVCYAGAVEEESLTASEVAALFRVQVATVRRWLRTGKLRGTPLSGRAGWRVPRSEVRRFMAEYRDGDRPRE